MCQPPRAASLSRISESRPRIGRLGKSASSFRSSKMVQAETFRSTQAWLALYGAAWTLLAWPWLSGAVTIPWDAKAHFYPQLQFLAQSIHRGDSPFWAPFVFSGQPQVADPQSLIFSLPFLALAA